MLNPLIKKLAKSIVPRKYHPDAYLPRLVWERTGMVVTGGCFAGLAFPKEMKRNGLVPKLLGTYERELAPIIEGIAAFGYETIVNVGAAEGYYAVGLARRMPHAVVHAFEADEDVRSLLEATVAANGVANRVVTRGQCEPVDLRDCLATGDGRRHLVICDVEGHESVLLDPDLVPQLVHAHILVELHEVRSPGVKELLRTRFQGSHQIEEIWEEERSATDYPFRTWYTQLLPDRFLRNAVGEGRSRRQSWLWMSPR